MINIIGKITTFSVTGLLTYCSLTYLIPLYEKYIVYQYSFIAIIFLGMLVNVFIDLIIVIKLTFRKVNDENT